MVYQKDRHSLRPREILAQEKKCIENHVPVCQASCPLHVDARAMMAFAKEGHWQEASEPLSKAAYFPRILAQGCSQPCQAGCKRREAGGAININGIEQLIVRQAEFAAREIDPYVRLPLKVAIVGAGICGLFAAAHLADKGFQVTVFEKEETWVKNLRLLPGLTAEMIEEDLAFLKKHVDFSFQTEIGKDLSYGYLFGAFDAVFLTNGGDLEATGLALDPDGRPVLDGETLQSSNPKVFIGGSAAGHSDDLVGRMAIGKRAGVSLDRFLKQVSLSASRSREGAYQTELRVNIAGQEAIPPVAAQDPFGYTQEEGQKEAARCFDCHCNECVRGCVLLEQFEQKPLQYIRQISNNLITALGKHSANHLINACTFCGLCGEVCPNALDMGDICLSAREEMVRKNIMPLAIHDFPIRDMLFSNGGEFSLCRHAPGTDNSSYLFFPGCQQAAGAPQYIQPLYDYLRANLPGNTGLFLGCCGAPAHWSGRSELFQETVSQLEQKWQEMGKPIVVTGCTTCYQELKNIEGMELITLWQCIDKYGLPKEALKGSHMEPVAVHDPCTTRHEPQIYESVRHILAELACPVEELAYAKDKTCCCGYGGLAIFGNPEVTMAALKDRVAQSPRDYLTYCWVCRDYFTTKGQKKTVHLLDLLFNGGEASPCYDISDKRFNRRRLKEELLSSVWREKEAAVTPPEPVVEGRSLHIDPALRELLARRLILAEDAAGAVAYAEASGNKVVRPADGHYFAHYQPGIITYWVEYSQQGEQFILHNAYSHRLEIMGE